MKKIILIIILASLAGTYSCKDDFLQQNNPMQMTSEGFWKTQNDLYAGLTACYSMLLLEGNYRKWHTWSLEVRSDLGRCESAWREFSNLAKFRYNDPSFGPISYHWQSEYEMIYRCNSVLKYGQSIPMDASLKQRYFAEATFLRALIYFNLVNIYGNPPLVTEPSETAKEKLFNATPEQIYDLIESDLINAINVLPWTYTQKDHGRATKGAAKTLLAKAYMQQHKWQLAYDQLHDIIEGDGKVCGYALMDNWEDNFTTVAEMNKESIFEIQFAYNLADWPDYFTANSPTCTQMAIYKAPRKLGGHSDEMPTYFWLTCFTDTTAVVDTGKYANIANADPRRDLSLWWRYMPYLKGADTIYQQVWYSTTGKYVGMQPITIGEPSEIDTTNSGDINLTMWTKKYTNGYRRDTKNTENAYSDINYRLMRYADILLLYAEDINELNGPGDARIYQYVNMVRQRPSVGLTPISQSSVQNDPKLAGTSDPKVKVRWQIERERICELGGEAQRWFDMMRYGYFFRQSGVDTLQKHDYEFYGPAKMFPFEVGKSQYYPIPRGELQMDPNLKQNPGDFSY